MKAFRFNLEQVLRLKRWREEEAKKALAVEVVALEKLKARLTELEGELGATLGSPPGTEPPSGFDFRGRLGILQYARYLGEVIAGQEGEVAAQGEKLKEKSDALKLAMQDRKVMEKLKEKRYLEFQVERNRKDYAALDEASAAFLQRSARERRETFDREDASSTTEIESAPQGGPGS